VLESGHHGDLWLDPELLCLRPREVRPFDRWRWSWRIDRKLAIDAVCGLLIEGAFEALMVEEELVVPLTHAWARATAATAR
jgi:hypothetical protein